MAKGIRVSELAKELGVANKVLLEKAKAEGLGEKAPLHSSTIALGLADTFREWHKNGELASYIEKFGGATASKKKAAPKKKAGSADTGDEDGGVATMVSPADDASEAGDTVVTAETSAPTATSGGDEGASEDSAEDQTSGPVDTPPQVKPTAATMTGPRVISGTASNTPTKATSALTDTILRPTTARPKPVQPVAKAPVSPPPATGPVAPAAEATPPAAGEAATPPVAPPVNIPKAIPPAPSARPTVRLEKSGPARPERPKALPAAPFTPKPAVLAGPKLVREEKPDIVSAPRKRPLPGQGPMGPSIPGVNTAKAGRGVKVTEGEGEGDAKGAAKPATARRRGPDGRRGEADEKLREFSEQDLKDRADRINSASALRQSVDMHLRKTEARGTHIQSRTMAQRGGVLEIEEPITVRSLSTALGVKSNELLSKLIKQGIFANINQNLDFDTASVLALAYNVELEIMRQPTMEEVLMAEFDEASAQSTNRQPRPAVVTILGHVDHGKTSLLDKIRTATVAAGEAGGITQHIAAWSVKTENGKNVTFIDTPGHQAFTAMRARGANMTDVVVLVVDAAQGIQPQTSESINHAKAAGVPIVVAMNKIDRPDANPDMVLGQLAGAGLNPVEWGGDVEVIRTSAVTGQGIPELLEILDYQSELRELKADPASPARGTVIEARMHPGLGPIATVLVQDGTLKIGDVVLAGQGWGKVRSLLDDKLKMVQEAGPSMPIIISGLSELPSAGDKFFAMDDLDRARSIAEERVATERSDALANRTKVSLDSIYGQMKESQIKTINLIIKADVQGSVETLEKTVTEQNTEEVRVKVIHSAAGPISESDIELADASGAVIIGFNVVAEDAARQMADQRRVEIRTYRVIYEIFDDLKKALSGMLEPETREKLHGHAEVRAIFKVSRLGNIVGCMVTDGHIQRGSRLRLSRDGKIITEDLTIESLKRIKEDVKEVKTGFECGIKIANYDDLKIGDVLEAYIRETFQRTL
ncbi:MAG: infB [Phycisphaerales bacterium]|nr:infB [Phycisphaerales bacterium]